MAQKLIEKGKKVVSADGPIAKAITRIATGVRRLKSPGESSSEVIASGSDSAETPLAGHDVQKEPVASPDLEQLDRDVAATEPVKPRETPDVVGSLQLVERGQMIVRATDGTETLPSSIDVFYHIDPNLDTLGFNVVGQPTKPTVVDLFVMAHDGSVRGIFDGFHVPLHQLALEWGQITVYARAHASRLLKAERERLIFLMRVSSKGVDQHVVVSVSLNPPGSRFSARFCQISDVRVSRDERTRIFVVVPKL